MADEEGRAQVERATRAREGENMAALLEVVQVDSQQALVGWSFGGVIKGAWP